MSQLTSSNLKGIWCSIQLPIQSDNAIDFGALQEEIEFLTTTSVHGLYSNGTAAEFYNQTEEEFDRISEMLSTGCHRANRPFQIGVSHMSPITSLERIKRARNFNPSAFQVILPHWMKLNPDEVVSFFEKVIASAGPIPVVLYNPGHAQTFLTPIDFKYLADLFPQIIGIKTGGGNSTWYEEVRTLQPDLAIFVPGHKLATGIKEGVAQGSYSNMACLNPNATRRWYDTIRTDIHEGLRIEERINTFFARYILPLSQAGFSDAALDKLLWSLGDRKNAHPRIRWPYKGIDPIHIGKIKEAGKKILPEFF